MLPRLPETLLSSCNDGLQEGDKLGIALRLPDEVVDVRRDHITVPVHDARRKRAQLGKPKLGRDLPAHEDDAFGFERGDARLLEQRAFDARSTVCSDSPSP